MRVGRNCLRSYLVIGLLPIVMLAMVPPPVRAAPPEQEERAKEGVSVREETADLAAYSAWVALTDTPEWKPPAEWEVDPILRAFAQSSLPPGPLERVCEDTFGDGICFCVTAPGNGCTGVQASCWLIQC